MGIADYMTRKGLTDAALGAKLGVSGDLVRLWRLGLQPVGAKRVLAVEAETGIRKHVLRPDLYPPPAPRKRRMVPDGAEPAPEPAEAAD